MPTMDWKINLLKSLFIPFIIALSLIFLRWQYGVLLFHTLAELFSIIVGVLMLVVVWNTRSFTRNDFLIYLGIGYFWIAVLDTWHTFTVKGMPFFHIVNAEPTLHFWIYARLLEALLLLSAPIFLKRSLNIYYMLYCGGLICLLVIWASLNFQQPVMLTSEGLTTFKIITEYVIMLLLCIAAGIYIKQRRLLAENVLYFLLISIALTVLAEFFFTQYTDFYGTPFFIGHLFKFLSFWMIYQAIVSTTLKQPFSVMAEASNSYDAIPHAAVVVDNHCIISQLNRHAVKLTGLKKEALLHHNVHPYFHPHHIAAEDCELCSLIHNGIAVDSRVVHFPEKNQWFVISLAPIIAGNVTSGMIQSSTDITAQIIATQKLEQSEQLFKTVINATPDWIFIKDTQFRYIFVNKGYAEALNNQPEEFYGKTDVEMGFPHDLIFGDKDKGIRGFRADDIDVLNGCTLQNPYDPATFSDGSLHIFDTYKTPLYDSNKEIYAALGIARDITILKQSEEELRHLSQYDQLTELPNRNLLSYQLEQAIYRAERNGNKVALLFLDLDNFKQINDTLGHSVGDKVLKDVAQKFRACIRKDDLLSRQGGDEFLVLLEGLTHGHEASVSAQKLINSLKEPISINGHQFYIGVSIGISLFPDDGLESEQLIKNADSAMYLSKNTRKNRYSFFTLQLNQNTERRFMLESHLRSALQKQEIYIVYQPQIDINNNQINGFEALIRWQHPELGMVSPAEFIPVAEATGLINTIGQFVLQKAVEQIQNWNKKFNQKFTMSINVSSRQFEDSELPDMINVIMDQYQCPPDTIKVEITESLLLQQNERVLDLLTRIADSGIDIALDDFGTGYSSLSYLKKFPINIVKIDQSFIRDITKDTEDAILVKTIISMANGLGMATIAEGVETIEQLTFLDVEGCHLIQGYYFSKPLKANDIEEFIINWKKE